MQNLDETKLSDIARFFGALSEPRRLKILQHLRVRPMKVGELAQVCESSVPNVSRHLAQMALQGLVKRKAQGVCAIYEVAHPSIDALCDLACRFPPHNKPSQSKHKKGL